MMPTRTLLAALPLSLWLAVAAAPALAGYEIKGAPPGGVKVEQTSDNGKLTVRITGGDLFVEDTSGSQQLLGIPKSIKVQMAPIGGGLNIDLDDPLPGNLDIRLEDAINLDFVGSDNTIGGVHEEVVELFEEIVQLATRVATTTFFP